ncbi:hypothetical protein Sjap_014238 [Stephania japonica]|uniref:GDSL esterase/lipase n=1 Tax=Stephania japonica TaxID=461633 RepID=A0AAP0J202_9MAGN
MASFLIVFTVLVTIISFDKCTCTSTNEPRYPAIFVFGDSTVDTGMNNYISTEMKSDHPPYGRDLTNHLPTGRFSNGRLVPDMLASSLGIKEMVPPYLSPVLSKEDLMTGVSFASAGSGIDDLTTAVSGVVPVSKQPSYFLQYKERLKIAVGEEQATKIVNGGLVVISAGSNDFLFDFYAVPIRKIQYNISGYQDYLLQRVQSVVKELYNSGCRNFAISGLGPIGCVPIEVNTRSGSKNCLDDVNSDAQVYNSKLQQILPSLQASLSGSKFLYADIYSPWMDVLKNPQNYGFKEIKKGCCGYTGYVEMGPLCSSLTPVCANASEYLFWDAVHPSEAAYKLLTKSLMDTIFLY